MHVFMHDELRQGRVQEVTEQLRKTRKEEKGVNARSKCFIKITEQALFSG